MIEYNKEYFKNNCYFFLKDKGDTVSLYYSVSDTIVESRKKDKKKDFNKKDKNKLDRVINKSLNKKGKVTQKELESELNDIAVKKEIDELVDSDGTMLTSKVPILNMPMHPRKTTDQTIPMARVSNDPVTRGYRVYWGESEESNDDVISEIDFSDAFGYEETKDKDFKTTKKILKKMGIEDPVELEKRTKQLGKLRKAKVKKGKDGKLKLKQRLTEKDSLEEAEKRKAEKMLEDILSKKKKDNSDVIKKKKGDSEVIEKGGSSLKNILMKNLKSIKNLADKEGININQLIKALKEDE